MDFSRLTRKELRLGAVDTRQLVEQVIAEQRQILGAEAGERLVVHVADLPAIEADLILLKMVFANLLSNAFKFTRTVDNHIASLPHLRRHTQPIAAGLQDFAVHQMRIRRKQHLAGRVGAPPRRQRDDAPRHDKPTAEFITDERGYPKVKRAAGWLGQSRQPRR